MAGHDHHNNQEFDVLFPSDPAPDREQHGFARTKCDCAPCRIPCKHVPGGLDPADLSRLCPEGQDMLTWAEEHLRALTHRSYPILVPARQTGGHCHWLVDDKCAVHEHAPYGCAFFDSHMAADDIERRYQASVAVRRDDAEAEGVYYRVWRHLCAKGLVGRPGSRAALAEEIGQLRRRAERQWQRRHET